MTGNELADDRAPLGNDDLLLLGTAARLTVRDDERNRLLIRAHHHFDPEAFVTAMLE